MDLGIAKRVALVNGGSAGMGKGSALALSEEGAEVFISARGEERLLRACEQISRKTGNQVTPIVADHSTDEGRDVILNACPEPDILVSKFGLIVLILGQKDPIQRVIKHHVMTKCTTGLAKKKGA